VTTFTDSYEYQNLLSISKAHLDALDRTRFINGRVIGQDNFNNLSVATVFACVAVETALNDYLASHFLFIDNRYLQAFFAEAKRGLLRSDVPTKIKTVKKFWPDDIPQDVIADVLAMFEIRNRIVHQTPELKLAKDSSDGHAYMGNSRLTEKDMAHMLLHHEIASRFLGLFWIPGSRELEQWSGANQAGESDEPLA
jgi:hypothetical protein